MTSARRRLVLQAATCFTMLWLAGPARLAAQDAYPSRTITVVVPYTGVVGSTAWPGSWPRTSRLAWGSR